MLTNWPRSGDLISGLSAFCSYHLLALQPPLAHPLAPSTLLTTTLLLIMPGDCVFCGVQFTERYASKHYRLCEKYIFSICQDPNAKASDSNPSELVVRNEAGLVICKCISASGVLCTKRFINESALRQHLRRNKHMWKVN